MRIFGRVILKLAIIYSSRALDRLTEGLAEKRNIREGTPFLLVLLRWRSSH